MDKNSLPTRLRERLWSIRGNKKAQIWLMAGVVVVLLIVLIVVITMINRNANKTAVIKSEPVNLNQNNVAETGETVRRFIDGVKVDKGKENLYPVAVMIENLDTTRPQAGLQAANVVYEALAEGGITRFMAIYATGDEIERIGPVRSARPYFINWAEEYQGLYVHLGGSPQALDQLYNNPFITSVGVHNYDSSYFWRDTATAAPHNLFTSSTLIAYAMRDNSLENKPGTYAPWLFASPASKSDRPQEEKNIKINYYSENYSVEYKYDREENNYKRFNGGGEHLDQLTLKQITVRNVVVQFVNTELLEADSGRLQITTQGSGRAVIFRNGLGQEGEWRKNSDTERTRFYTSSGTEVEFIPGNIWLEVLPEDRTLEYN